MSKTEEEHKIIAATEKYVMDYFETEGTGHDWWHIYRVWNLSKKIAENEGGRLFIIEMAALLHDLEDWKLTSEKTDGNVLAWLNKTGVFEKDADKISEIISQVSFKGANVENTAISLEAKIVQDADRLDAIGAIGIARTFAYGGNKGRIIYHPDVSPVLHTDFESYKKSTSPTINHFYEKLLLIKQRLNTKTAIVIAEKRHKFMEEFLNQFFNEWRGLE